MADQQNLRRGRAAATALALAWTVAGATIAGAEEATLEEITVTARRVQENLQDTPISITAITGEGLERRQIFTTDNLDNLVPNLQFANNAPLAGNNNSSQVFIRGIGQTDPTATVDPGVGIYIDDVYMGQSVGGTMDFRDVAGVQVLRGPQGALFGRNTIGGAILINSVEPGETVGGHISAGLGTDDLRKIFAALDLPLGGNLRSRFTAGFRDQDGYVKRVSDGIDLGDKHSYTLTGKLILTASDRLTLKLLFDYTRADENGSPLVFAASNETAIFQRTVSLDAGCPGMASLADAVPLIDDARCANDFWNAGPFAASGTNPLESLLENWGVSFHATYNLNERITLKSITSYRGLDWSGIRDADNTPFPILHTDYDSRGNQFSQEFQALYAGERLTGVAGLYFFNEETDDIMKVTLAPPPAPGGTLDSNNNLTENKNFALFGQATYDVTTALSLSLGGRFTSETKASTPDQFNFANPDIKYLEVRKYSRDFKAFNISANASYRFSPEFMAYMSYSEGFKSGGWNSHFNNVASQALLDQVHAFADESAENLEIGFKADLADNSLRINAAAFTTNYNNLQLVYRFGVAPFLLNAGKASNKGFEVEVTWLPTEGLIIDGGIGYLDATIDEVVTFANAATGVEAGNKLPFAPEWQGNLGVGYSFTPAGLGYSLTPQANLSFQSKTFFDAVNTEEVAQGKSRTTLDVSLAIAPASESWKLIFGILNLTDELYPIGGNSSLGTGSGYAEIAYARQRQWFLTLDYSF